MPNLTKQAIKRLLQIYIGIIIQAALIFVVAGRFDLIRVWIYFGIGTIYHTGSIAVIFAFWRERIIEVAAARTKLAPGTKTWDKILLGIYGVLTFSLPIVAGLDIGRFSLSNMPFYTIIPGIILLILGHILIESALVVNKFFEPGVRIQKERGQTVIQKGPYRFVRHPGYTSLILLMISFPLIVGSVYSFIPAGLICLIMIIRTYLEDKTLQNELEGYVDYAKKVRYKLIPGIW